MSTGHANAVRIWGTVWTLLAMTALCLGAAEPLAAAERLGTYETAKQRFHLVKVANGLEHPWGLAFLPDGRMLVTERPGRLRIVDGGKLVSEPIPGVPEVWADGQGGLLDVALHPDFAENGLVYLSYASPDDDDEAATAVARAAGSSATAWRMRRSSTLPCHATTMADTSARAWSSPTVTSSSPPAIGAIQTAPRSWTTRRAASSVCTTTGACLRTIPSSGLLARGPSSTPSATATPRA